jgi:hypothetical protein
MRLAWHCDDNDAQLGRMNISYHEAKRSMRSPTTLTLYTTRPRAAGSRGVETQPPPPTTPQGKRTKHSRPSHRLIIAAGFTSMLMRFAHRPRDLDRASRPRRRCAGPPASKELCCDFVGQRRVTAPAQPTVATWGLRRSWRRRSRKASTAHRDWASRPRRRYAGPPARKLYCDIVGQRRVAESAQPKRPVPCPADCSLAAST